MASLKELYPFSSFRPGVEELLDKIETSQDKKFFIIRAPTGVGKSGISVAISRMENCHILTATKLLQDQYANTPEFQEEFVLKGKSNYTCNLTGEDMGEAPCSHKDLVNIGKKILQEQNHEDEIKDTKSLRACCVLTNGCEYYTKKAMLENENAGGGILNYDLAFLVKPKGKAIILDEAHNFIDKLLDVYSFEFSREKLRKIISFKEDVTQTNYIDWLKNLAQAIRIKLEGQGTAADDKLKELGSKVKGILLQAKDPGDFYVESNETQIVIKPLKPSMIAHRFFAQYERIYFLSATLDSSFAAVLKMAKAQTVEFNLKSIFAAEKRPIYIPKNIPNINYATKFDMSNPSIQMLKIIMDRHAGQRGLIHCANYRIQETLEFLLGKKNKRMLFVDRGTDKQVALQKHMLKADSVLVSPSMTEGVDLKDDLARWQVIFKVPYPAKTEYITALEETLPGYYSMATRNALVQAYGRVVRNENDWAHTYVLDGSIKMMLNQLDNYFFEAVRQGDLDKLKTALESGAIGGSLEDT